MYFSPLLFHHCCPFSFCLWRTYMVGRMVWRGRDRGKLVDPPRFILKDDHSTRVCVCICMNLCRINSLSIHWNRSCRTLLYFWMLILKLMLVNTSQVSEVEMLVLVHVSCVVYHTRIFCKNVGTDCDGISLRSSLALTPSLPYSICRLTSLTLSTIQILTGSAR